MGKDIKKTESDDKEIERIRLKVRETIESGESNRDIEVDLAANDPEKKQKFKTRYLLSDEDRYLYERQKDEWDKNRGLLKEQNDIDLLADELVREEKEKEIKEDRQEISTKEKVKKRSNGTLTKKPVYTTPEASAQKRYGSFIGQTVKGVPDWGVYSRNYGYPYKSVFVMSVIGVAYFFFAWVLSLAGLNIPYGIGAVEWVVQVYCTACFVGLPASIIVPKLSFKKFKNDYILFEPDTFTYHKTEVKGMAPEGEIEAYEEFEVKSLRSIHETVGYFRLRGVIERVKVINGKKGKKKMFRTCVLPKAFTEMENVEKYLASGQNEYHYVRFKDVDEEEYKKGGTRRQSAYYRKYHKY